jgi:hypothetical protein
MGPACSGRRAQKGNKMQRTSLSDLLLNTKADEDGCLLWQGSLDRKGYGKTRFQGVNGYCHRFAYALSNGPIPDGYEVDHLCFKPGCINPEHLEAVTRDENLRRRRNHGSIQGFCKHGHPRKPEDRICLECKRAGVRRWHHEVFKARRPKAKVGHRDACRAKEATKLTLDDAVAILRLRKEGALAKVIASQFGISKNHVYAIEHGRYWPDARKAFEEAA